MCGCEYALPLVRRVSRAAWVPLSDRSTQFLRMIMKQYMCIFCTLRYERLERDGGGNVGYAAVPVCAKRDLCGNNGSLRNVSRSMSLQLCCEPRIARCAESTKDFTQIALKARLGFGAGRESAGKVPFYGGVVSEKGVERRCVLFGQVGGESSPRERRSCASRSHAQRARCSDLAGKGSARGRNLHHAALLYQTYCNYAKGLEVVGS